MSVNIKKIICVMVGGVLVVGGVAAGYWLVWRDTPTPTRKERDLSGVVLPVAVPLRGQLFTVPEQSDTTVILDLVSPTATRDYPMGRFAVATGTGQGTLVALDDFVTAEVAGKRAVPIAVNLGGTGTFYYLAILESSNGELRHLSSLPLGDRIKVTGVTVDNNLVTVNYLVHDRTQALAEIPSVATSAIVDVTTATLVQAGRQPWLEEVIVTKEMRGTYEWQKTVSPDGSEVVPSQAAVFTLTFDINRLSLTTDCNSGSAEFTPPTGSSTALTVGPIVSTKMFCESSEEAPYFAMIADVTSFTEVTAGIELQLSDGRTMYFGQTGGDIRYEATDDSATN